MKNIEIKEEFELNIKRFYLPIIIKRKCPNCNNECEEDLGYSYLSYPTVNKKERLHFYCPECDCEFEIDRILKISLQLDEKVRIL